MPNPNDYDNKDDFISACISKNIKEGLTKEQASGKCYGIWEEAKKSETVSKLQSIQKSMIEIINKCKK